jgi:3-carboxy-cis,cis-muconate cycloisomerase
MVLQLQAALQLINKELKQLIHQLISLMEWHRSTIMIGRSFLQHARPITFGLKVAGWLEGIIRSKKRVEKLFAENMVLQLGGAVGTLSGMGDKGLQVAETMSFNLRLNTPAISWHTQRDRLTEIATTLGILTGSVGKIAKDVSLLMQTEIAEVFEPAATGKGGSSSMPNKRNPVGCVAILSNASRVPALVSTMLGCLVQDQERATGNWHTEWETLADIVRLTAGVIHQACIITNGLEVDPEKMLANLELTNGLIYAENISLALTKHVGKETAHTLLEELCKEAVVSKIHLKELVQKNETISKYLPLLQIDDLFNPANSIGLCASLIERVEATLAT